MCLSFKLNKESNMLNLINSPEDLKRLTADQLPSVVAGIRDLIIEATSSNGGHIAPSLGTVECTVVMHYLFNSPADKFIWDVGHQCYAHKILTGRKDQFMTLRKYKGLSGFPKRSESPHDVLDTGHSSTSICAGAGIAHARELKHEDFYILPFIGDGALTGGLALEGLNYSGNCVFKKFIIVLNDNKMSISENVGAISHYLRKMKLYGYVAPNAYRIRDGVDSFLKSLPTIGKNVSNIFEHFSNNVKNLITPGAIFQDLGFEYIGPIDGHNIPELIEGFNIARMIKTGPVLLHIKTVKGNGYTPAMSNPSLFHGLGPFQKKTGEIIRTSTEPSYSKIFGNAIIEEAEKDENIVAITAAMPDGTGLTGFKNRFPDRFFDVGIAEQSAVELAVGLALEGKKPVVAVYSTFMQRAFDQLIHDVALQNLPIVFVLDRGGLVGDDGPTHHGTFDLTYMRMIPNFIVLAPGYSDEVSSMLSFALQSKQPVSIRIPRGTACPRPTACTILEMNSFAAEKVNSGKNISILAVGKMVSNVMASVPRITESLGFSPTVYNYRFIKPLPVEPVHEAVSKKDLLITVEENTLIGGFGSAVNDLVMSSGHSVNSLNIGLPDLFIEQGSIEELHELVGLSPEKLSEQIIAFYRSIRATA